MLSGPSTSSPSSPAHRKTLGLTEYPPAVVLGHRHGACACRSQLQTQGVRAKKLPKAKGGRGNDHGQLFPFRDWLRRTLPTLKTWCNSSLQHKELFAACKNSTTLKIRLKYFAEPESWSGGLCALKMGKQASGAGGGMPQPVNIAMCP